MCKAIFGLWSCRAKIRLGRHMHIKPTKITLLGLKMTTSERVKSATVGPVTDTYLKLKMLCLFYFVLASDN